MNWLSQLGRRLLMLFRHGQFHADLEEEMRLHRELREEEKVAEGLSPTEARYAISRQFGNDLALRERSSDMWGWNWLETLLQDIRYSLRQLRRDPVFTTVAILTLALGIGVNTAMFNLVNAMLLRPLPVSNPGDLVELFTLNPARSNSPYSLFSYPMVEEIARSQHVFSEVSAWTYPMLPIEVGAQTFPGGACITTGNYFQLLGMRPALGRFLSTKDEAGPVQRPLAVISYPFWQTRFSGNANALGRILKVNGKPYTIIGVAPKDFSGMLTGDSVDAWLPLKSTNAREDQNLYVTARLKPGVGIRQARAQLQTLWPSILAATAPERVGPQRRASFLAQRIRVAPAKMGVLAYSLTLFQRPLIILMASAAFVLLIACLNLAGLMLARSVAREHEMGVRTALGASRGRLIRQLLTESILLAGSGTLLAIPIALWASRSLARSVWTGITPLALNMSVGGRIS